jgi:hypothetical protein
MIRISITAAAFEAIEPAMPVGNVAVEPQTDEKGERQIWLEPRVLNKLRAIQRRHPARRQGATAMTKPLTFVSRAERPRSGRFHYVYAAHRQDGMPFYIGMSGGYRIDDHKRAVRRNVANPVCIHIRDMDDRGVPTAGRS